MNLCVFPCRANSRQVPEADNENFLNEFMQHRHDTEAVLAFFMALFWHFLVLHRIF